MAGQASYKVPSTGVKLILGSKVQCLFCVETCTTEGRGGEKGGVCKYQNKARATFNPRNNFTPVHYDYHFESLPLFLRSVTVILSKQVDEMPLVVVVPVGVVSPEDLLPCVRPPVEAAVRGRVGRAAEADAAVAAGGVQVAAVGRGAVAPLQFQGDCRLLCSLHGKNR